MFTTIKMWLPVGGLLSPQLRQNNKPSLLSKLCAIANFILFLFYDNCNNEGKRGTVILNFSIVNALLPLY